MAMVWDQRLRDILVCPRDKGDLLLVDDGLYNPRLRLLYPVTNDIPMLLSSEAKTIDDDAQHEVYCQSVLS